MDTTQTNTAKQAIFQALQGIPQEQLLAFFANLPPTAGAANAMPPAVVVAPSIPQRNHVSPKGSNTPNSYALVAGKEYAAADKATTMADDEDFFEDKDYHADPGISGVKAASSTVFKEYVERTAAADAELLDMTKQVLEDRGNFDRPMLWWK